MPLRSNAERDLYEYEYVKDRLVVRQRCPPPRHVGTLLSQAR